MTRSNEAFWWSLFSAGGVMSAIFIPALIVITGLVLPFMAGDDPAAHYERLDGVVSSWIARLILFGILMLSFFHCAHRIRHILFDLGLRHTGMLLSVVCYGAAILGTVLAAYILVTL